MPIVTFRPNANRKSAGLLNAPLGQIQAFTTTGAPFILPVKDDVLGSSIAAVGDILRLKAFNGTTVLDNWFQVMAADTSPVGYTNFTVERRSGTPGIFPAGAAVVNYKQANQGWIIQTADDVDGPYLSVRTHSGAPWASQTEQVRLGNLRNTFGYGATPIYGLTAGQYNTAGKSWLAVDPTNGFRLGSGTQTRLSMDTTNGLVLRDSTGAIQLQLDMAGSAVFSGNLSAAGGTFAGALSAATGTFAGSLSAATGTFAGSLTAGSGSITGALAIGAGGNIHSVATGLLTNDTGYWLDNSGGTARFRIGSANGTILTNGISWDGTTIRISAKTAAFGFGSTPPTSASAGTGLWLDQTGLYGLKANVVQAKLDAVTGAVTAGVDVVTLDSGGITIVGSKTGLYVPVNSIDFKQTVADGGDIFAHFYGAYSWAANAWGSFVIADTRLLAGEADVYLQALSPTGFQALVGLQAQTVAGKYAYVMPQVDASGFQQVMLQTGTANGCTLIAGSGLVVGSSASAAPLGTIKAQGAITLNGALTWTTDATYDIGAAGATRPRSLYLSGAITAGGAATINGALLWTTDNTYDIGASGANRPNNIYTGSDVFLGGKVFGGGQASSFMWGAYASLAGGSTARQAGPTAGCLGFIFVYDATSGGWGTFFLTGGVHLAQLIAGNMTVTKGTATSINVYWDTVNLRYEIQNTNVAAHTIGVMYLGQV